MEALDQDVVACLLAAVAELHMLILTLLREEPAENERLRGCA